METYLKEIEELEKKLKELKKRNLELAEKLLLIEADVDKIIKIADLTAHC